LLISLFQICVTHAYHSNVFKAINIITFRNTNKIDYTISKVYKLIVLLNTIDKIMKFIMNKKISWFTKTHRLLFNLYINVRFDRSIETTLKLLTKQIHIVWNQNTNRVIILLNLNVAKVFDMISHSRLIHNLRKWKISQWIINWVSNFMQNKSITLTINRRVIESFAMSIDIWQNFLNSSFLYFFNNADLLEMCNRFDTNTRFFVYVDDANILTYDKSTKKNCRTLKKIYWFCEK
jgi:hypothetical protein